MSASQEMLATLYTRHHAGLVAQLCRRGATPWRAEDLVQEAYLRLHTRPEPPLEPQAYTHRIARNLLVDAARRDQRQATAIDTLAPVEPATDATSGETTLLARETTEQLHTALAALPAELRRALAARLAGHTFAEVATADHVTTKTAFERVGRAVALLRQGLAPDAPPDRHWRSRLPGHCPMSPPIAD